MPQMIDKGIEVHLLQAFDMETGFPEVLAIEAGEGAQAGTVGDHRAVGAIPAIQVVLEGRHHVVPVGVGTVFQWNFLRV